MARRRSQARTARAGRLAIMNWRLRAFKAATSHQSRDASNQVLRNTRSAVWSATKGALIAARCRCVFRMKDESRDVGGLVSTQRTAVRRAHLIDLLLPAFERQRRLGINHAFRMTKEAVLIDNCHLFAVSCEGLVAKGQRDLLRG